MANKTINGITTELDSVANADLFPVWDASEGKTAKVTKSTLLDGMQEELTFDTAPTSSSTNPVTSGGVFSANAVITASSTTLTGVTISSGSVIRVMFTSAITGSDTTTALSLTYNGTSYPVKVGKQGSLSNFVASYVDSAYTYLQAYTTLELAFDGTQFIIIGNPVVLSSADYTIYADGLRAFPSNNLGKDLYSSYTTETAFVYGSKVIKSGVNVTSEGTEVDISDVLALFNIKTGYYSFILRITTRATTTYMYDEYIISNNGGGGRVIKINSDPNNVSRTITPSAPTSSTITLTSSSSTGTALMLTFEPIGYY